MIGRYITCRYISSRYMCGSTNYSVGVTSLSFEFGLNCLFFTQIRANINIIIIYMLFQFIRSQQHFSTLNQTREYQLNDTVDSRFENEYITHITNATV